MATIPLEAAAAAMREAMRDTVKRYSLWYLLQGILMVVAGFLALVYPLIASVAIVYLLAWVLIISGIVQGIGLIGAARCRISGCSSSPSSSPSSSASSFCAIRRREC
jgi:uncharacterized membrane protein HdeD (DUF308 family)